MKPARTSLALICQLAFLFLLLAFIVKPSGNLLNMELTAFGIVVAGFYWICVIIEITATRQLQVYQKIFWLIVTISTPFLGAIVYQLTHP